MSPKDKKLLIALIIFTLIMPLIACIIVTYPDLINVSSNNSFLGSILGSIGGIIFTGAYISFLMWFSSLAYFIISIPIGVLTAYLVHKGYKKDSFNTIYLGLAIFLIYWSILAFYLRTSSHQF